MEQAKKECILVEAARAFARWGFKKASIDEIARAAGVAKGTVYLAAESKEDLYYQALHREVRHHVAEVSKLIDPRVPADQILVQMSIEGLRRLAEESALVRELLTGRTREILPLWDERLHQLRLLGNGAVIEVLRLGIRQGVFRADLDVEPTAQILQDLQCAGYLFHTGPLHAEGLPRLQAAAFELVLRGLRADQPVPPDSVNRRDPQAVPGPPARRGPRAAQRRS